jgi:translation initiation factor IF-1
VVELLEGQLFRVRMSNGDEVIVSVTEEFRRTHVRVKLGDKVEIVRSEADPSRGRITGAAT